LGSGRGVVYWGQGAAGMLKIESQFETEFHQHLATREWQAKLTACVADALASHSEYRTVKGTGIVRSRYNEDRYMGPLSVVKYNFLVEVQVCRGGLTWRKDKYCAAIRYSATTEKFEITREEISTIETRARDGRNRAIVNRFIKCVQSGCSQEEVDRFKCPWCDATTTVNFHRSGTTFCVRCANSSEHLSKHATLTTPPPWWREKVGGGWMETG
jgi:hypothetical protein